MIMLYSSHSSTPDACIPPVWYTLADFGGCSICACDSFYRCLTRGIADRSWHSRHAAEVRRLYAAREPETAFCSQHTTCVHFPFVSYTAEVKSSEWQSHVSCSKTRQFAFWMKVGSVEDFEAPMRIFSPPSSFTALRFVVATSALDARSEYHINQALNVMTKGRTGMDIRCISCCICG